MIITGFMVNLKKWGYTYRGHTLIQSIKQIYIAISDR